MKSWFLIFAIVLNVLKLSAQIKTTGQFIDSLFRSVNNTLSPGIAITILQNGKTVTKKAYGMANLEHEIAFTHNTPVRLGYSGAREFLLN